MQAPFLLGGSDICVTGTPLRANRVQLVAGTAHHRLGSGSSYVFFRTLENYQALGIVES
jgi:hypothetical protein